MHQSSAFPPRRLLACDEANTHRLLRQALKSVTARLVLELVDPQRYKKACGRGYQEAKNQRPHDRGCPFWKWQVHPGQNEEHQFNHDKHRFNAVESLKPLIKQGFHSELPFWFLLNAPAPKIYACACWGQNARLLARKFSSRHRYEMTVLVPIAGPNRSETITRSGTRTSPRRRSSGTPSYQGNQCSSTVHNLSCCRDLADRNDPLSYRTNCRPSAAAH